MAARPLSYDSNSSDTENCEQRSSSRPRRVYRHSG
ncbi:BTB/POZ domain-containing protein 10a isoform X2, partial [Tachysurus ichikawai]